ncbi:hypothetical protein [Persephonella sp.]
MENKILENILLEERDRLLGRLKIIEERIASLPSGWIRKIKKGDKTYKYLYISKREGKAVKSIFSGKVDEKTEKLIEERKRLVEERKRLKKKINELNKILRLANGRRNR